MLHFSVYGNEINGVQKTPYPRRIKISKNCIQFIYIYNLAPRCQITEEKRKRTRYRTRLQHPNDSYPEDFRSERRSYLCNSMDALCGGKRERGSLRKMARRREGVSSFSGHLPAYRLSLDSPLRSSVRIKFNDGLLRLLAAKLYRASDAGCWRGRAGGAWMPTIITAKRWTPVNSRHGKDAVRHK